MNVHIVMHESFESPGAMETWARRQNHSVTYTRLYEGDAFPNLNDFDFLIVMGGPQSPATTQKECPHFDGPKEISFIKKAIAQDKLVLGVCLGAQMIGEALGARFEHSPHREIGVFPITLTADGKKDPLCGAFPEKFNVGHWHGDMPGLTPESKVLATSEGCPRQIVRYTPRVYGFQAHFEFTPEAVENLIRNSTAELEEHKNSPFVQSPEKLRTNQHEEMNHILFGFLDRLTKSRS